MRYISAAVISFAIGIMLSMLTATAFASPVVDEEAAMECVAEWELNSNPDEPVDPTKPLGRKKAHVWKGVDPGTHRFMGWPI